MRSSSDAGDKDMDVPEAPVQTRSGGIPAFRGDAFVAFVDLLAFKHLMSLGEGVKALSTFHQYGQLWIQAEAQHLVTGLFVFDSGVVWTRGSTDEMLQSLLRIIMRLSSTMISHDLIPAASIAFGPFEYRGVARSEDVEQHLLLGDAYVRAYEDCNSRRERTPTCRVIRYNLPEWAMEGLRRPTEGIVLNETPEGFDFFWMLDSPVE